jgi:hypothetical protein
VEQQKDRKEAENPTPEGNLPRVGVVHPEWGDERSEEEEELFFSTLDRCVEEPPGEKKEEGDQGDIKIVGMHITQHE